MMGVDDDFHFHNLRLDRPSVKMDNHDIDQYSTSIAGKIEGPSCTTGSHPSSPLRSILRQSSRAPPDQHQRQQSSYAFPFFASADAYTNSTVPSNSGKNGFVPVPLWKTWDPSTWQWIDGLVRGDDGSFNRCGDDGTPSAGVSESTSCEDDDDEGGGQSITPKNKQVDAIWSPVASTLSGSEDDFTTDDEGDDEDTCRHQCERHRMSATEVKQEGTKSKSSKSPAAQQSVEGNTKKTGAVVRRDSSRHFLTLLGRFQNPSVHSKKTSGTSSYCTNNNGRETSFQFFSKKNKTKIDDDDHVVEEEPSNGEEYIYATVEWSDDVRDDNDEDDDDDDDDEKIRGPRERLRPSEERGRRLRLRKPSRNLGNGVQSSHSRDLVNSGDKINDCDRSKMTLRRIHQLLADDEDILGPCSVPDVMKQSRSRSHTHHRQNVSRSRSRGRSNSPSRHRRSLSKRREARSTSSSRRRGKERDNRKVEHIDGEVKININKSRPRSTSFRKVQPSPKLSMHPASGNVGTKRPRAKAEPTETKDGGYEEYKQSNIREHKRRGIQETKELLVRSWSVVSSNSRHLGEKILSSTRKSRSHKLAARIEPEAKRRKKESTDLLVSSDLVGLRDGTTRDIDIVTSTPTKETPKKTNAKQKLVVCIDVKQAPCHGTIFNQHNKTTSYGSTEEVQDPSSISNREEVELIPVVNRDGSAGVVLLTNADKCCSKKQLQLVGKFEEEPTLDPNVNLLRGTIDQTTHSSHVDTQVNSIFPPSITDRQLTYVSSDTSVVRFRLPTLRNNNNNNNNNNSNKSYKKNAKEPRGRLFHRGRTNFRASAAGLVIRRNDLATELVAGQPVVVSKPTTDTMPDHLQEVIDAITKVKLHAERLGLTENDIINVISSPDPNQALRNNNPALRTLKQNQDGKPCHQTTQDSSVSYDLPSHSSISTLTFGI